MLSDDMRLREFNGKRVKLVADDGNSYIGIADLHTSALDNPDGVESICVGDIEFTRPEIISIALDVMDK